MSTYGSAPNLALGIVSLPSDLEKWDLYPAPTESITSPPAIRVCTHWTHPYGNNFGWKLEFVISYDHSNISDMNIVFEPSIGIKIIAIDCTLVVRPWPNFPFAGSLRRPLESYEVSHHGHLIPYDAQVLQSVGVQTWHSCGSQMAWPQID